MRIISLDEVGNLTGIACKGGESQSLAMVLDMILPRVEDVMNVASLARGKFVDTFVLPRFDPQQSPLQLRLSNGYVVKDTIKVFNPAGEDTFADLETYLDLELGTVGLLSWTGGAIRLEYESGFAPIPETMDDPNNPGTQIPKPVNELVLGGVPDWIKAIATGFVVEWYRTFQIQPKFKPEVSYAQVEAALRRHIYARVYSRYMRPRAAVVWSSQMERAD